MQCVSATANHGTQAAPPLPQREDNFSVGDRRRIGVPIEPYFLSADNKLTHDLSSREARHGSDEEEQPFARAARRRAPSLSVDANSMCNADDGCREYSNQDTAERVPSRVFTKESADDAAQERRQSKRNGPRELDLAVASMKWGIRCSDLRATDPSGAQLCDTGSALIQSYRRRGNRPSSRLKGHLLTLAALRFRDPNNHSGLLQPETANQTAHGPYFDIRPADRHDYGIRPVIERGHCVHRVRISWRKDTEVHFLGCIQDREKKRDWSNVCCLRSKQDGNLVRQRRVIVTVSQS